MNEVTDPRDPDPPEEFDTAKQATSELQGALEAVFFSEVELPRGVTLGSLSRKYLSF